ncbi:L-lactate dehydrogenase [Emcibacter nanhaiensis]|uniref:L-lactate dehydrogenase n=1 Tax=Emcibacter nanhaiensis TaxID=1505037 RepID=A0A501PD28_9PROT|nr:L-lactate dehydrogenase [Emcibacter nanhaiensis]TPD57907.1 L-lactate dehydrogenase [Emcibacter nanhaiensis]
MAIFAVSDFREAARRRLPDFLFNYIDGGAFEEVTLGRNQADLQSLTLRQRVLRDVSDMDLSVNLFGQELAAPFLLGPVGLAGMAARRGEVQAARAAAAAGVPFCLSTVSTCSLQEVTQGAGSPPWFQLYITRDRSITEALLDQAIETKCTALVVTVDMPMSGIRYRDFRSGMSGAPGLKGQARRLFQALCRPSWSWDVGLMGRPHGFGNIAPFMGGNTGMEDFVSWVAGNFDPTVTWKDIDHIRSRWSGPLLIKGILDPEDAQTACAAGVDGIIVSNHGGRQLDSAPSTASVLPSIVKAVDGKATVLADGGVRTGADVVKMLALGAQGVFLGRAWAYALAAGGQDGVARMIDLLMTEMRVTMALTGVAQVQEICSKVLVRQ